MCQGTKLLFHVEATGVALSYQWFFGPTQLSETSPVLQINSANASHAGDYSCIVSTANCTITPSQPVTLTVVTTCKNTTNTIIFYIGAQTLQSFNDSYRGMYSVLFNLCIITTHHTILHRTSPHCTAPHRTSLHRIALLMKSITQTLCFCRVLWRFWPKRVSL